MSSSIFAEWALRLRTAGLEPRPVQPGTKACKVKNWQQPDSFFDVSELQRWERDYPTYGVAVRTGTTLLDGTKLGVLDVDDERYRRVGVALLRDPPCLRVGKKGAAIFFRYRTQPQRRRFSTIFPGESEPQLVAELLVEGALCVIPPTLHPDTGRPYEWIGRPLHEIDLLTLPLVGDE